MTISMATDREIVKRLKGDTKPGASVAKTAHSNPTIAARLKRFDCSRSQARKLDSPPAETELVIATAKKRSWRGARFARALSWP
jgi:hypothetical protein